MRRALVLALLAAAALAATARPAAAVAWCGTDRATSDRTPALELSSPYQVHVVYAIPSDGADRFDGDASAIATDIAAIDAWWRGQDATRTPRFDLYPFPGCASRFGDLDLGFARLPHDGAYYTASDREERIAADLSPFALPTLKNIVYYDGPVSEPLICGSTDYLAPDDGGPYGFVFVWLQSGCGNDLGAGGRKARTAAHELLHNLGAVMPQAPHQCPSADNAGHVCDSSADILYPFASASSTLAGAILDIDHDDYYGHSGSWWDVQDSRWLIHLPQHALTVALAGAGTVSIPGGFACTSTCSTTWDDGLTVSLSAEPGPGQRFAGWSGACTGVGPCSLTLTADTSVTATFVPAVSKLSVAVAGRGRVTSSPAGISCPGRCSASFPDGRTVALRAAAAPGFRFAGWTGACGGKGRCAVTLDGDRAVRAVFRKKA